METETMLRITILLYSVACLSQLWLIRSLRKEIRRLNKADARKFAAWPLLIQALKDTERVQMYGPADAVRGQIEAALAAARDD